jgi:hypothetical protein
MNYSDYISNHLTKAISYSEYVAEKSYFSYSDYENIDKNIVYTDYFRMMIKDRRKKKIKNLFK